MICSKRCEQWRGDIVKQGRWGCLELGEQGRGRGSKSDLSAKLGASKGEARVQYDNAGYCSWMGHRADETHSSFGKELDVFPLFVLSVLRSCFFFDLLLLSRPSWWAP